MESFFWPNGVSVGLRIIITKVNVPVHLSMMLLSFLLLLLITGTFTKHREGKSIKVSILCIGLLLMLCLVTYSFLHPCLKAYTQDELNIYVQSILDKHKDLEQKVDKAESVSDRNRIDQQLNQLESGVVLVQQTIKEYSDPYGLDYTKLLSIDFDSH